MKKCIFLILISIALQTSAQNAFNQKPTVDAAKAFLNALTADQRTTAQFTFADTARTKWSNLPNGQVTRNGAWFKDLTDIQKQKVHNLLHTVLSQQGYLKFLFIMEYDEGIHTRLTAASNPIANRYGNQNYWTSIFGEPSVGGTWGFKFEGHHISLNMTFSKMSVTCTPMFTGINPALVTTGEYAGKHIMYEEDTLGKGLYNSLSPTLKAKARLGELPKDVDVMVQTGKEPFVKMKQGVTFLELNEEQKAMVVGLIESWVKNLTPSVADEKMKRIRRSLNDMRFVWMGSEDVTQLHYFRLQSPACIIEFSNRDGGIYHYHTMWRDIDEDFIDKK